MRDIGIALTVLLLSVTVAEAAKAPRQLQGLWTESPATCATYKSRGPDFLLNGIRQGASNAFVTIGAETVSGTTKGKVLRSNGARTIEVQDSDNPNITIDFTLRRDGFLEETVIGARASMMYVRCQ